MSMVLTFPRELWRNNYLLQMWHQRETKGMIPLQSILVNQWISRDTYKSMNEDLLTYTQAIQKQLHHRVLVEDWCISDTRKLQPWSSLMIPYNPVTYITWELGAYESSKFQELLETCEFCLLIESDKPHLLLNLNEFFPGRNFHFRKK